MNRSDRRRFALRLHYHGADFHGWQLQKNVPTVQGAVEAVLERITGQRRPVVASGRTDAGVHATGQVASVDLPERWDAPSLRAALNALLPRSVWVEEVRRVPDDFHPRFHAIRRSYRYHLGTADDVGSPFKRSTCWALGPVEPWDEELLHRGAAAIPGTRSFRRFAKAGQPERGEECRVERAEWSPLEGIGYVFRISADRYLHHMVRYLTGTMVEVARGHRPLDHMLTMLNDPDTDLRTSPPAPSEGLFLYEVEYPESRWGTSPDRDPSPPNPRTPTP